MDEMQRVVEEKAKEWKQEVTPPETVRLNVYQMAYAAGFQAGNDWTIKQLAQNLGTHS